MPTKTVTAVECYHCNKLHKTTSNYIIFKGEIRNIYQITRGSGYLLQSTDEVYFCNIHCLAEYVEKNIQ